jgi:outer membrane protein assembly factor BamB
MKSRYAVRRDGLTRRTALAALAAPFGAAAAAWPEFRGQGGSIAPGPDLPVEWLDSKNVAWNVALPGYGQSSPVLQGGRLFLTSTSGSHKEALSVLAYDAASGRQLWRRDLDPTQKLENSDTVTKASATAAADGERVYVFFETGELAAFSHEGEVVWQRSLTREYGFFEGNHGVGSSLRLARAGLLALAAHIGPSYLLCVDPATGRNRWKTPRPPQMAWSTPAVTTHLDREIVLVSGGDRVDAYAAEDGSPLWTVDGVKGVTIPTPTPFPGGAVVGSSDKGQSCAIAFPASRSRDHGLPQPPPQIRTSGFPALRISEQADHDSGVKAIRIPG